MIRHTIGVATESARENKEEEVLAELDIDRNYNIANIMFSHNNYHYDIEINVDDFLIVN